MCINSVLQVWIWIADSTLQLSLNQLSIRVKSMNPELMRLCTRFYWCACILGCLMGIQQISNLALWDQKMSVLMHIRNLLSRLQDRVLYFWRTMATLYLFLKIRKLQSLGLTQMHHMSCLVTMKACFVSWLSLQNSKFESIPHCNTCLNIDSMQSVMAFSSKDISETDIRALTSLTSNCGLISNSSDAWPAYVVVWTQSRLCAGIPCRYITPLDGLMNFGVGDYQKVHYAPGCADTACEGGDLIPDAVAVASNADTVLLAQEQETESLDRTSLLLPGFQQDLISAVATYANGCPVVLVIMSAGPVDISVAKEDSRIQSIMWVGYPGEAGGQAIANIIFGYHNPGKLRFQQ